MAEAESEWSIGSRVPDGDPARANASAATALRPGSRFANRFLVLAPLGRGGMGQVYRARDLTSEREVALKLLSRGLSATSRERLLREGQLTASLRHPGIVGIHSAGEAQGIPYLAYELVEGGRTLADVLPQRSLTERVALLRDVALALGHAHRHGVIHRDVKAENILIDPQGRPRVADFGLARAESADQLTRTGALVGTPFSMAPEQILGKREEVGPWSDVWSLGVLLYQALTDQLPFQRESFLELSAAICDATPAPPRSLNPDVPAALEGVCLRALAREPVDRYPDAAALAADLSAHLEDRAVSASATRALRGSSRRWRWLTAALVLLALLGGGLLALRERDRDAGLRRALETARGAPSERATRQLAAVTDRSPQASPDLLRDACLLLAESSLPAPTRLDFARRAESLGTPPQRLALNRAGLYRQLGRRRDEAQALALAARRDPEQLLPLAQAWLACGEADSAAEAASRYLLKRPASAQGLCALGLAKAAQGDAEGAREAGRQAARASDPLAGTLVRTRILTALDDDPQQVFQEASGRWPGQPQVLLAWARYLLEVRHDAQAARLLFERAGSEPEPLAGWVQTLLGPQPGQLAEVLPPAERGWAAACLLRDGARQVALVLRQRDPRLRLPLPKLEQEASARAAPLLRAALALAPSPRDQAAAHVQLAWLADPTTPEGLAHAQQAGQLDPGLPQAAGLLARVHLQQGAAQLARQALAAARAPPLDQGLLEGWASLEAGELATAAERLEAYWLPLRDDPLVCQLLLRARTGLGQTERVAELRRREQILSGAFAAGAHASYEQVDGPPLRAMHKEQALRTLDGLLELAPHDAEILIARAREGVATVGGAENMRLLAEGVWRDPSWLDSVHESLVSYSTTATLLAGEGAVGRQFEELAGGAGQGDERMLAYSRAWVAEVEGRMDPAWLWDSVRALDALLDQDPGDLAALVFRGFLQVRLGHLAEATVDLQAVLGLEPKNVMALLYRGLLLAAQEAPPDQVVAQLLQAMDAGYDACDREGWSLSRYPELGAYLDRPELEPYVH